MTKHFVLLINEPTKLQSNIITQTLKKHGVFWSHYFEGAWLVRDSDSRRSAAYWRDKLTGILGKRLTVMVLQVEPTTWAAFANKKMSSWMEKQWTKPKT